MPFLSVSLSRDACRCLEQHLALARGGLDFRSPCPGLQVQGFRCVCITTCSVVCFPPLLREFRAGTHPADLLSASSEKGLLPFIFLLFVFRDRDSLCRSCSSGAQCVNLAGRRMRAILLLQPPKHCTKGMHYRAQPIYLFLV